MTSQQEALSKLNRETFISSILYIIVFLNISHTQQSHHLIPDEHSNSPNLYIFLCFFYVTWIRRRAERETGVRERYLMWRDQDVDGRGAREEKLWWPKVIIKRFRVGYLKNIMPRGSEPLEHLRNPRRRRKTSFFNLFFLLLHKSRCSWVRRIRAESEWYPGTRSDPSCTHH